MYLDNAASTPILNEVTVNLVRQLEIFGNPSSLHTEGIKAKNLINNATKIISNKLHCDSNEIYYTSGATMSNNLIIQGFFRENPKGKLIISEIEHNDIIELYDWLNKNDYQVYKIPVNKDGFLDLHFLQGLLNSFEKLNKISNKENPILCSIQMANGEIGTIQNIKKISNIIHTYKNTYLHTDATQYIPYYPIDVKKLNIDALSMSGQKIGCIKGTGLLYKSNKLKIQPLIFGEQGLLGGTENVLGIHCLGIAFDNLEYNYNTQFIRDYLIDKLKDIGGNIVGSLNERIPNNVCVLFDGIIGEKFSVLLNELDIQCSSGSACSSGRNKPSHVIQAIGYDNKKASSSVRFSLNNNITISDIDYLIEQIKICLNLTR